MKVLVIFPRLGELPVLTWDPPVVRLSVAGHPHAARNLRRRSGGGLGALLGGGLGLGLGRGPQLKGNCSPTTRVGVDNLWMRVTRSECSANECELRWSCKALTQADISKGLTQADTCTMQHTTHSKTETTGTSLSDDSSESENSQSRSSVSALELELELAELEQASQSANSGQPSSSTAGMGPGAATTAGMGPGAVAAGAGARAGAAAAGAVAAGTSLLGPGRQARKSPVAAPPAAPSLTRDVSVQTMLSSAIRALLRNAPVLG